MNFFGVFVAILAVIILFLVWGGVHLLARKHLGDRKLGCRGPVYDESGKPMCCQNPDEPCETAGQVDDPPSSQGS